MIFPSKLIIRGDTLWDISLKSIISLTELISANPQIVNPNLIYPGEIINVPLPIDFTYYTVEKRDTIFIGNNKKNVDLFRKKFII